jgi:hypothetical protein
VCEGYDEGKGGGESKKSSFSLATHPLRPMTEEYTKIIGELFIKPTMDRSIIPIKTISDELSQSAQITSPAMLCIFLLRKKAIKNRRNARK